MATPRIAMGATLLSLTLVAGSMSFAREPGIGPTTVPGLTLGQANAVPLSPGVRVASRSAYSDSMIIGNDFQPTGLRYQIPSEAFIVTWVPDVKILGAGYKTFVLVPFVSATLVREAPVPAAARGTFTQFGAANPKLQIVDLSWTLGDGFYVNSGFGVFFPLGQWALNAPVTIGAPFWTFEPSAAFSYFKDGWTASLQAIYNTNTINPANQYYSGDQVILNATFMKMFGGVNVGPVGYWLKQVTNDANYGGRTVFGGVTAPPGEQLAIGATVSTQFGNLSVQLMFTQDVYAQNALSGAKGWLNLSYHFH